MVDPIPPTSPSTCIPKPSLPLGGSERSGGAGGGSLQSLLNQLGTPGVLMPGDTIVCPAGATYTPIVMPARSDSGWIAIVSSDAGALPEGTRVSVASAGSMFTIQNSVVNGYAISGGPGTQGWIFLGCRVTSTVVTTGLVVFEAGLSLTPARIVLDRCLLHGDDLINQRCGLVLMAFDFRVVDCAIIGFRHTDVETQAIFVNGGARNHIENCQLEGAGENILLGDTTTGGGPPWAQSCNDLTIIRNTMFKPYRWRRYLPVPDAQGQPIISPEYDGIYTSIKNLFEIKWAKRVLLEGNILEHHWPYQGDQPGQWSFIHAGVDGTSDIMIRHNTVREATGGITLRSWPELGPAWTLQRIAILNNLFNVGSRALLTNKEVSDLWVEHNTAYPMQQDTFPLYPAIGQDLGAIVHTNLISAGSAKFLMKRNVFGKCFYGIFFGGGIEPDPGYATYFTDVTHAENAMFGPESLPAATGWTYYSIAASGVNQADGTLALDSPLKNASSESPPKDLGVDFAALYAAQTGTPTVPVAGMSAQQVAGTFGVNFIDVSSGWPTSGTWDFGDGNTSTLLNHNRYDYAAPGTYTVTHTVQNSLGSDSVTQDVVVVLAFGFVRGAVATVGAGQTTVPIQVAQINVGDLVIVSLNRCDAPSIDSMDDTLGNVYSALSGQFSPILGGAYKSRTFYTVATAGGFNPVITGRLSGPTATFARILYREYACPHPIGLVGSNLSPPTTSGTPMNSGNVTVSKANSLLIGYHDFDFASTPTMPSGWTLRDERFTADRINVAAGTYAFQPTFTGTQGWIAQIAAFEFDAEASTQVDVAGTDTL